MLILVLLSFLAFGSPLFTTDKQNGANNHPTLQVPDPPVKNITSECCGPDPIPPVPPTGR